MIKRVSVRLLCSAALAVPAALAAGAGQAAAAENPVAVDQESARPVAAEEGQGQAVDDILVTARFRREDAQSLPVAISSIGRSQLETLGPTFNLFQLAQQLPSLNIQGYTGRNTTLNIRGIGNLAGMTSDGLELGVGVYVDGVYRARAGQALTDLVDVESIQLLRGPQGTLFGKNTVAGAIDIRSVEPRPEWALNVEGSYGSFDYARLAVTGQAPLSPDAAIRLSYLRNSRDGYIHNVRRRERLDNLDNHSVRGDVLFEPGVVKLRLIADYSRNEGNLGYALPIQVLPTTLANGAPFIGFYDRAAASGYTPLPIDPFARRIDSDQRAFSRTENWGVQGRIELPVGRLTLSSITAYREWNYYPETDADFLGADIFSGATGTEQRQFSQELRLASPGGERIDYTLGLYYLYQRTDNIFPVRYGADFATWLLGLPASLGPAVAELGSIGVTRPATRSYAAFGQATWTFADAWRLTAGLRYTYERKSAFFETSVGGNPAPLSSFPEELRSTVADLRAALAPVATWQDNRNFDDFSGTLALQHDFAPGASGYLSYSRGFKSGGVNLGQRAPGQDVFVDPEIVDAFELGVKSRLLDSAIEANLALFWTDVRDFQANSLDILVTPPAASIRNAGKLRSRGVELDVRARVAEGLNLNLSGAYTDARYVRYVNAPPAFLYRYLPVVDLSGEPVAGVPRWALSANANYSRAIAQSGDGPIEFFTAADVVYRSGFFSDGTNDIFSHVPSRTLLGASLGIRGGRGAWEIQLWGRNLLQSRYFNVAIPVPSLGLALGPVGEPRQFGVTVRGRF